MGKLSKNPEVIQKMIIEHTRINISIRKKLKVMIQKLPVAEPLERIILDFVGMPKFTF
jgi:hypothetical protein